MRIIKQKWKEKSIAIAAGTLLTLSSLSTPVAADDSEVFFGQIDQSLKIFPNVLFVLDTSGSMNWYDSGEPNNRITRMKEALNLILDSTTNVNVGLMRFNGSSGGGPVLFPITYIDEQVCETGDCGQVSLISRISNSDNDAEESTPTGSVLVTGVVLDLGDAQASTHEVGLRFTDLDIPSGATITSASVEFVSLTDKSGATSLKIKAEDVDHSAPYTTSAGNVTSRPVVTPEVDWSPGAWTADNLYESPDISSLVQAVVDRSGWCGGNALSLIVEGTGERQGYTFDRHPNHAATLKVTYDSTSIPSGQGCMQKTVVSSIASSSDDAEQRMSNNKVDTGSSDLELATDSSTQLIGMRFRNIDLPKGATITEANIEFEIDEYKTGNVTLDIWGHDTNDSWYYRKKKRDISNRTKTTAKVSWVNPPVASINSKITSPDLSSIVTEITSRGGWSAGNDMSFFIGHQSGSGKRTVESYNGEKTAAPKLRIQYQLNVAATGVVAHISARDKMKQIVNNLTATGGTPIVDAMYEAALYYKGMEVDYGTERGPSNSRFHRVSNPLSYTGGSVSRNASCTDANLDSSSCGTEEIATGSEGPPMYISPLESSCQTNHIVLLSDGEPTSNSASDKVKTLTTDSSCSDTGSRKCGTELTSWLHGNDHSSDLLGNQYISTYTIGLNLNSAFLEDLASHGGGSYYTASSATSLVNVFTNILGDVMSIDTSFVAPGATVNQFNRLTHRNDIYFSLFKPKETPKWDGNLKKYKLKKASDGIVRLFDSSAPTEAAPNGKLAVDPASGFFANETRSFWSTSNDGNAVAEGGSASKINLTNRKVYTYTGSAAANNVQLNAAVNRLHENNRSNISKNLLGIATATDAEHQDLLKWARGVDVQDYDGDTDKTEARKQMGDPMHSRPLIINYASTDTEGDSTIYVSTNEGFVHAIKHTDGSEIFSFMPQELWGNLATYYDNQSSERHPYGLDGTMSSWLSDENNNTVVDSGEKAYIYMGMRRGGKNYYSMDVSDRSNPKLKWVIKGGTGDFAQLGETWSKMIPARVKLNSVEKEVLIFAGGYDTNQDPDEDGLLTSRAQDTVGRAIYMVDANTGAKLWSGSGYSAGTGGTAAHTYFSDMKYSIPSDLRVIDIDFDGYVDQMWVGDMGGQVWRFDVNNHDTSQAFMSGGVMAEFSEDSDPTKARRFYYEPDVSLMTQYGKKFLAVAIGSGWRASPLSTEINDRVYVLRSDTLYGKPEGYGKVVDPTATTRTYSKITEADLTDITDDMNTKVDYSSKSGWMLRMTRTGEKILSNSITVNGQIIFTSYVPDQATEACTTAIGGGRVYVLDALNGKPKLNLDEEGTDHELTETDRSKELAHGGIPPEPAALITEEGDPIILVGPEQPLDDLEFGDLTQRTYWREEDLSNVETTTAVADETGNP